MKLIFQTKNNNLMMKKKKLMGKYNNISIKDIRKILKVSIIFNI